MDHNFKSYPIDDDLHIVVPINNYIRYKRRYELFQKFKETLLQTPKIKLYIVEIAFGDRPFAVTETGNPAHLQLRTDNELWHKENSINLMVQRFPPGWKYMAWVDGDIEFHNKNFAVETIHQLQHYPIVQMFQSVVNLGPTDEVVNTFKSFAYQYHSGKKYQGDGYEVWHPGFAYACTRKAFNDIGGLLDFAILGAGDHHMALALIGQADKSLPGNVHGAYTRKVLEFQTRCERYIHRNIGYVNGTIIHHWHGPFKSRKYKERWSIITSNNFDPDNDIKRDCQGLYIFNTTNYKLRDDIRAYFRQRNEDSIDPE
jgi:hypothetical protein